MIENSQKTEEVRPIQHWENVAIDHKGKASKTVYDAYVASVAELRQMQEAYESSLPKDPIEALAEISAIGKRDLRNIYENDCAARLAYVIIYEVVDKIEEDVDMQDALKWLARLGRNAVDNLDADLTRMHEIARQFHPNHEAFRA